MTDEYLTAFAAKAYGDAPPGFSPLTDDGDTLRLEVALKYQISVRWSLVWKKWVAETNEGVIRDDDRKRCSVRAAAAIGSAMVDKL